VIYLDTHVVVWLYAGEHARLSQTGRRLVESESLLISPALLLELALLEETGRIKINAREIVAELESSLGLSVCNATFAEVASVSLQQQHWTRDPFDRLLVGHALARGAQLLTKDRLIAGTFGRLSGRKHRPSFAQGAGFLEDIEPFSRVDEPPKVGGRASLQFRSPARENLQVSRHYQALRVRRSCSWSNVVACRKGVSTLLEAPSRNCTRVAG
jgi:PIN domain nuclease of toxin-antitoxin system